MKKYIIFSLTLLLTLLAALTAGASVLAEEGSSDGLGAVSFNPVSAPGTFPAIINTVFSASLGFLGVVALLAFIWGGLIWMTSGGDTAKIMKAKKTMTWAVAGLVIIFAAFSILTLIFNAFGYPTPGAKTK